MLRENVRIYGRTDARPATKTADDSRVPASRRSNDLEQSARASRALRTEAEFESIRRFARSPTTPLDPWDPFQGSKSTATCRHYTRRCIASRVTPPRASCIFLSSRHLVFPSHSSAVVIKERIRAYQSFYLHGLFPLPPIRPGIIGNSVSIMRRERAYDRPGIDTRQIADEARYTW